MHLFDENGQGMELEPQANEPLNVCQQVEVGNCLVAHGQVRTAMYLATH